MCNYTAAVKRAVCLGIAALWFVPGMSYAQDHEDGKTPTDEAVTEDADVLEVGPVSVADTVESEVLRGARPSFAQTIMEPQLQSIHDWLESAPGVYGDSTGKGTRTIQVRGFTSRQLNIQFAGMPLDTGYESMSPVDVIPRNWIGAGRIAHADASPVDGVGFGGKIDLYALDPHNWKLPSRFRAPL